VSGKVCTSAFRIRFAVRGIDELKLSRPDYDSAEH
jgi:hypothetical protein